MPSAYLSDAYWQTADKRGQDSVTLAIDLQFVDEDTYQKLAQSAGVALSSESPRLLTLAKLPSGPKDQTVDDLPDLFSDTSVPVTLAPSADGQPLSEQAQTAMLATASFLPPDIPPTKEKSAYAKQNDYFCQIIAPYSLKDQLAPRDAAYDVRVKGLTFSSSDPTLTAAEMKRMLSQHAPASPYLFFNTDEAFAENRSYIFIANVFAYTFIIMISLIATANVFNTISTNIKLRRRELAMLRSLGMGEKSFDRMMRFECALYGLKALLIGLPLALAACWFIHQSMLKAGAGNIAFQLPWASIGISILSVLAVIFITMWYAVRRLRQENIIEALRDE